MFFKSFTFGLIVVQVTPSSKVVGDLAQFMVQNKLTRESLVEKAEELSFPNSVMQFFQASFSIFEKGSAFWFTQESIKDVPNEAEIKFAGKL